jgi:phosphate transport system substrate-binding protein
MSNFARSHRMPWVALAFLVVPAMVACSGSKNESAQNSNRVIGAGSSFIYPVMTRWISDFEQSHPGVEINY